MPFSALCPGCEALIRVADHLKGKKIRCKKCQAVFVGHAADEGEVVKTSVRAELPAKTKPVPRLRPEAEDAPPRRRPRDVEEDELEPDVAIRARPIAEKAPRELVWAVVLLFIVGALDAFLSLFMLIATSTDGGRRAPADIRLVVTVFGSVLLAMAVAAILGALMLLRRNRLGYFLAWIVAIRCLPEVPLHTIAGVSIIRSLLATATLDYLRGRPETEAESTARRRIIWILGGSVGGVLLLLIGGLWFWVLAG